MTRFWDKVDKTQDCWEWTAAIRNKKAGYGAFKYEGKTYDAHRFSFFLTTGAFPTGFLMHLCDNRKCVRPEHLKDGTPQENALDMTRKGRRYIPKGSDIACSKLTETQVREIRQKYTPGVYGVRQLTKEYGLKSVSSIQNIINRKTWKHLAP